MDDLLEQVLRTSPEPYEYFDEQRVHRLLTRRPADYIRFLRSELADIAAGRARLELPPKQVFVDPGDDADFRIMPCVLRRDGWARKTVKLVGTNAARRIVPGQVTVGKAFALHPVENFVTHIFEACLLSSARTGACAALATELLAGRRNMMTIIGAGKVGYYCALFAAALGGVEEIRLSDLDAERARRTAAALAGQFPSVRFEAQPFEALGGSDVLLLATTSTRPFCEPPGLGAELVISLGADTDFQRELDPAWAGIADIFVDTEDCVRFGDLRAWRESGLPDACGPADMLELMRSPAPLPAPRPRIFISTGSALFDNLTIGYLLERAANA
ncbi:MAG: hypothetical protein HYU77_08535 [Betaproteobacteria bacterium]|nr:hypothetical protein [Betaproteobacteria bacterium]